MAALVLEFLGIVAAILEKKMMAYGSRSLTSAQMMDKRVKAVVCDLPVYGKLKFHTEEYKLLSYYTKLNVTFHDGIK